MAETLKGVDAILFVVPTKVTRLVAQQVAAALDHKAAAVHAWGLEPDSHKRLSTVWKKKSLLNYMILLSSLNLAMLGGNRRPHITLDCACTGKHMVCLITLVNNYSSIYMIVIELKLAESKIIAVEENLMTRLR